MPQNKYALARYYLIDKLLRRQNYVKTIDIVENCKKELGCNISQRTIQMDIDAMKNDSFLGYFAPIEYCNRRKAYYYENIKYRLYPFQFSSNEMFLMKKLLILAANKISKGEFELLKSIFAKIKILNS